MSDPRVHDLSIQDVKRNAEQNRDVIAAIDRGLTEFNQSVQPDPLASPLVLAVHDDGTYWMPVNAGEPYYFVVRYYKPDVRKLPPKPCS
jgi:hypothetical protein